MRKTYPLNFQNCPNLVTLNPQFKKWRENSKLKKLISVWPDWAKFRHFGKILKVFGKLSVCLIMFNIAFGKICTYFGTFYATWQIVIAVNGQKVINYLAIWSHWLNSPFERIRLADDTWPAWAQVRGDPKTVSRATSRCPCRGRCRRGRTSGCSATPGRSGLPDRPWGRRRTPWLFDLTRTSMPLNSLCEGK